MRDAWRLRGAIIAAGLALGWTLSPVLEAPAPHRFLGFAAALVPYALLLLMTREPVPAATIDLSLGVGRTVQWGWVALLIVPAGTYFFAPLGLYLLLYDPPRSLIAGLTTLAAHWLLIQTARGIREDQAPRPATGVAWTPLVYAFVLVVALFVVADYRRTQELARYEQQRAAEQDSMRQEALTKLRTARRMWRSEQPPRAPVTMASDSCVAGGWSVTGLGAQLHAQRDTQLVSVQLADEPLVVRCTGDRVWALGDQRLIAFDGSLRMLWEVRLANFNYPLADPHELLWQYARVHAADERQVVLGVKGLIVIRREGLVALLDDEQDVREVTLVENRLYRLSARPTGPWVLDAFELP